MRTHSRCIVIVLTLASLFVALPVFAQEEKAAQAEDSSSVHFELTFDASLVNSYARGNLDDWFHEMSGDPERDVDAGSPAFFNFEFLILYSSAPDSWRIGSGVSYFLAADRALWGTKIVFGGGTELVLNPHIITIPLAIRVPIANNSFYGILQPALAFGWVDGYLDQGRTGRNRIDIFSTPKYGLGVGFQAVVGLEGTLFNTFGVSVKGGYRFLESELYTDSDALGSGSSYVEEDTYQVNVNGEPVVADLSGAFAVFGLSIHF